MSEESNELKMGTELEGDLPADAEVTEGTKPSDPAPAEDAEGRQGYGQGQGYFYWVCCPFHDCHANNRVFSTYHYVQCWSCRRTFHV